MYFKLEATFGGCELYPTKEGKAARIGASLADGSMGYDELLAWIREHAMLQEK